MPFNCKFVIFISVLLQVQGISFIPKENLNPNLQVITNNGVIQGRQDKTDSGKTFFIYLGIPYAQPPLYNLRFRGPQPMGNWSGILDTTKDASGCVEVIFSSGSLHVQGSEDCLNLNVYAPINPHENKETLLPVVFWVFGGAFIFGNASFYMYGPQYLIEKNLVVVTANYRLGMFGFLSTEDEASPGNYGLKDQTAALKWVRDNIKYFGGNPNKVTIIGESAGAASVAFHFLSPKSRNLFHGGIAMSGDALAPWAHQRSPKKVATDIGLNLEIDISNTSKFIETLRHMDSDTLIYGQIGPFIVNILQVIENGLPFGPVIEYNHPDAFITELSYDLMERGEFAKVPLIMGVTSKECHIFSQFFTPLQPLLILYDLSPSLLLSRINVNLPIHRRIVSKLIRRRYFPGGSYVSATRDEFMSYCGDESFVRSTEKSIRLFSKHIPVHLYVFKYKGETPIEVVGKFSKDIELDASEAAHSEDICYIWKTLNVSITSQKDKIVSEYFSTMVYNFAEFGNPTPKAAPELQNIIWPVITTESKNIDYLEIGANLKVLQNYRNEYIQFWNRIYKNYVQKPYYTY